MDKDFLELDSELKEKFFEIPDRFTRMTFLSFFKRSIRDLESKQEDQTDLLDRIVLRLLKIRIDDFKYLYPNEEIFSFFNLTFKMFNEFHKEDIVKKLCDFPEIARKINIISTKSFPGYFNFEKKEDIISLQEQIKLTISSDSGLLDIIRNQNQKGI